MTLAVPPAIIFINNSLSSQVQGVIERQLYIDQIFTGDQFDQWVQTDSNFVTKIKQLNRRVMVIREFDDYTNRELADIAIFVKEGMAAVEKNNFGPPSITLPVVNLYWGALGLFKAPKPL